MRPGCDGRRSSCIAVAGRQKQSTDGDYSFYRYWTRGSTAVPDLAALRRYSSNDNDNDNDNFIKNATNVRR